MAMKYILLAIPFLLLSLASANMEYFQYKQNNGGGEIQNHVFVMYGKGGTDDFITGDNPFEFYYSYSFYPKTWNDKNPLFAVDSCEIKIFVDTDSGSQQVFEANYTDADSDQANVKYFVRLNDGESSRFDELCQFVNANYTDLYLPAEVQVFTPSWECKACQFYEWSQTRVSADKSEAIGKNSASVSSYIKKLFDINYEIALASFWFFLIMMIFVGITLIFTGLYWVYLWIRNISR